MSARQDKNTLARNKLRTYQLMKDISNMLSRRRSETELLTEVRPSDRVVKRETKSRVSLKNSSSQYRHDCSQCPHGTGNENAQDLFTTLSTIEQILLQVSHDRKQLYNDIKDSSILQSNQSEGERGH